MVNESANGWLQGEREVERSREREREASSGKVIGRFMHGHAARAVISRRTVESNRDGVQPAAAVAVVKSTRICIHMRALR